LPPQDSIGCPERLQSAWAAAIATASADYEDVDDSDQANPFEPKIEKDEENDYQDEEDTLSSAFEKSDSSRSAGRPWRD
jgi:hypothetical protein